MEKNRIDIKRVHMSQQTDTRAMNQKEVFEEPMLEIIQFEITDVIVTSGYGFCGMYDMISTE